MKYCQCCAMPMGEGKELYGTNSDGSGNEDYCKYCFEKGEFTFNLYSIHKFSFPCNKKSD